MRWLLALVLLLGGCTSSTEPSPASSAPPTSAAGGPTAAPPTQLPATDPQVPTLAAFRRRAAKACVTANVAIGAAPLTGDPLVDDARRRDVAAAVAHYRTAAAAWTAAANDLWDFGLPPRGRVAQSLVTSLDTVGQYSHQTAELLAAGDSEGAQAALSAVDAAVKDTNSVTRRLGIGRIEECGVTTARLPNAKRLQVNALDFSFVAGQPRRGPTRFVLDNAGEEPHHLFVVPLREPGTVDDAVRADRFSRRPVDFLRGGGAVSLVAAPGETATIDVRLRSGVYGLLCFVASEDGTPHAYKGMATEITVP